MPSQRMYHVAPRSARESILANGLAPYWGDPNPDPADVAEWDEDWMLSGQDYPPGVHLWNNLEDAARYRNPQQHDLWEVDASGLPLEPDDWPHDEDEHLRDPSLPNYANSMVHDQLIPPDRLRLLNEGTTARVAAATRPWIMHQGTIYMGDPGQTHDEVVQKFKVPPSDDRDEGVVEDGKVSAHNKELIPQVLRYYDKHYKDDDTIHIAAAPVMYHVAPRHKRDSILTGGLDAATHATGFTKKNHMFDELRNAHRYARQTIWQDGEPAPYDVWEVNTSRLPLEVDSNFGEGIVWDQIDHQGPLTGAYRTDQPITPDNLRLLSGDNKRTLGYYARLVLDDIEAGLKVNSATKISGSKWCYLNGKIRQGEYYPDLIYNLAKDQGLQEADQLSNLVAINDWPLTEHNLAIGSWWNGKPQIERSNLDRQEVAEAIRALAGS